MENTPDTQITLNHGEWQLTVAPYGASLRGLSHADAPVVTAYTGAENKVGAQGDVLIPFPGRVTAGKYTFAGTDYQMVENDTEAASAIHGFLRKTLWDVSAQTAYAVTFTTTLAADAHPGYPFALAVSVTYALNGAGLETRFEIENIGDKPAPVAAGFHPYFTAGSALINTDTLQAPFSSYLEFKDLLPTGKVLPVGGTEFDFRQPRPIGETVLNICYLHPTRDADGRLRLRLSGSAAQKAGSPAHKTVTVWMDKAFDYVVLYSGDPLPAEHRRKSLAIEPMTCGADAFNHPDWGLVTLVPGETLAGSWGVGVD